MPRYTLTARTYINGSLGEAGDVVDYNGWPGSTLVPADDVAARIKDAYDTMRKRGRSIPRGLPDLSKYMGPAEKPPEKEQPNE